MSLSNDLDNIFIMGIFENRNILKIGSSCPYIKDISIDSNHEDGESNYRLIISKIYSGTKKYILITNCSGIPIGIGFESREEKSEGYNTTKITKSKDLKLLNFGETYYQQVYSGNYNIVYKIGENGIVKIFNHKWQNNEDTQKIKQMAQYIFQLSEVQSSELYNELINLKKKYELI